MRHRPSLALIAALAISVSASCLFSLSAEAAERLQSTKEIPVIVIDPGHGGENQGTQEGNQDEKYMTMATAIAMYNELILFDDVEVYLTHTDDRDMSLKERAEFASQVGADFLFSIHYNASENHELFGSEVWVQASAPYNGYGYQFGYEFLTAMKDRGLFVRGIKTRLNDKGNEYYGILRESLALGIPAVIIEHCHVDEPRDIEYCDGADDLVDRGKDDAHAVAKYLGLKSQYLGVDYSDYQLAEASDKAPVPITLKDSTAPDVCQIQFVDADYETGLLTLSVSAADYDSPLMYYTYSIDGGATYSPRNIWPGSDTLNGSYQDTFTLNLTIPDKTQPAVILRAYNMYDICTESNVYHSEKSFLYPTEDATLSDDSADTENILSSSDEANDTSKEQASLPVISPEPEVRQVSLLTFLKICLIVAAAVFVMLLISQAIEGHNRKKRRRQRGKTSGAARNRHR